MNVEELETEVVRIRAADLIIEAQVRIVDDVDVLDVVPVVEFVLVVLSAVLAVDIYIKVTAWQPRASPSGRATSRSARPETSLSAAGAPLSARRRCSTILK